MVPFSLLLTRPVRERWECLLIVLLLGTARCASGPPAAAVSQNPIPVVSNAPTVDEVAALLRLDPEQRRQTARLLDERDRRTAAIRAGWDRGEKVRPEALLESDAIFQREFFALLTDEQSQTLAKLKLDMLRARMGRPSGPPKS